ncbi:MAG: hypothetical protein JNL01_10600 [Bdellovibrionales bacterium]|nr:hypothetical protein [Bdellovibrionales bacterium]
MKKSKGASDYQKNFRSFTWAACAWFVVSIGILWGMGRTDLFKIFYTFFSLSILNLISLGRLIRALLFPQEVNRYGILVWMPLKFLSVGGAILAIFVLGKKDVLPAMLLGLSGWVSVPIGGMLLTRSNK